MKLECAGGTTATEMGQVMRLSEALRNTGGDAKELPWTTALYHQDFGFLRVKAQPGLLRTCDLRGATGAALE